MNLQEQEYVTFNHLYLWPYGMNFSLKKVSYVYVWQKISFWPQVEEIKCDILFFFSN